jgi:hypothetical protein
MRAARRTPRRYLVCTDSCLGGVKRPPAVTTVVIVNCVGSGQQKQLHAVICWQQAFVTLQWDLNSSTSKVADNLW